MENNQAPSFMLVVAVVTIYGVFSAMAEADDQNSKVSFKLFCFTLHGG